MNNSNKPAELIKIANFANRAGAEFAQSLLQEQGIMAEAIIPDAGGWGNYLLIGSSGIWVSVKEDDVDQASKILQDYDSPVDQDVLEAEALSFDPPADA